MAIFFHVGPPSTSTSLKSGDLVLPGSWGQKQRTSKKGGPTFGTYEEAYVLIREIALETARANNLPSRLDCVFACCTHNDTTSFRDRFRPNHQVHLIEPDPGFATFVADYDVITNSIEGAFVDTFVGQAIRYWTVPPVGRREVLIGGPALVK
jgi:hypothetical protein